MALQKFDPYLNLDPGTMNPYQHGEVFVTEDGAETDLDLGHYERFTDEDLTRDSSVTSGKIYWSVLSREREGAFLGGTVQVIPHITGEIKERIYRVGRREGVDVVITEIGGTVGDIESQPFLEAIRQVAAEVGRRNVLYLHVSLIVSIPGTGELKSKPTQHSVKELLSLGIQPDVILCRADGAIPEEVRDKIALFCNVPAEHVIPNATAPLLYEVPLLLEEAGLARAVCGALDLPERAPDLDGWRAMVERAKHPAGRVEIALVGKYVSLHDAYLSVTEALTHGGIENGVQVDIRWVDSEGLNDGNAAELLAGCAGVIVPGGFGSRGVEGMISAIRWARGKPGALFWHLPGDADGGGGVRPPRGRPGRRPLQRAGRHRPPGHRPDARAAKRRRQGRHHAAGGLSMPHHEPGYAGLPGLRRGGHLRAPPPPL